MTKKAGLDSTEDSTILLVILNLFMYIISAAILQDKLNAIWNSIPDDETVNNNESSNQ